MSVRFAFAALALLLVAGHAEAGIFGGGDKLPKPISMTGERVHRSRSEGFQGRHPPKEYSGIGWGRRQDLTLKVWVRPLKPSLHVH
jgi:hypothetical protein